MWALGIAVLLISQSSSGFKPTPWNPRPGVDVIPKKLIEGALLRAVGFPAWNVRLPDISSPPIASVKRAGDLDLIEVDQNIQQLRKIVNPRFLPNQPSLAFFEISDWPMPHRETSGFAYRVGESNVLVVQIDSDIGVLYNPDQGYPAAFSSQEMEKHVVQTALNVLNLPPGTQPAPLSLEAWPEHPGLCTGVLHLADAWVSIPHFVFLPPHSVNFCTDGSSVFYEFNLESGS